MTDKEADKAIQELVAALGDKFIADETRAQIMNFPRLKQLEFALKVTEAMVMGQGVKVTSKVNKPAKSVGSISIEGEHVVFREPAWFIEVTKLADNVDVYPLTNGRVRITFTFHRMTIPLEGVAK